jgi:hypothetical protein
MRCDARAHMGNAGAAAAGPAVTRTSGRSKADIMTPAACACGLGESCRLGKKTHDAELFVRSDGKSSGSGNLGSRQKKTSKLT